MQKLYSELLGMPVFDEYSQSPIALVQDLIIDPENGKLLAFLVKRDHIIVPYDIERLTSGGIYIADHERILPIADVLRVFEVRQMKIGIIGASVITDKTKTLLGRAVDYEIETKTMMLSKIHSAKVFLFFRFHERLIAYKSIVKINKHTIVIKDSAATIKVSEKEKAIVPTSAFAS